MKNTADKRNILAIVQLQSSMPTVLRSEAGTYIFVASQSLLLGALLISFVEGWSFSTGIYFVVIAVSTVGFGDIVPTSVLGKVLLIS